MNPPHDGLAAAANRPVGRLAGSRAAAEELFSACYPGRLGPAAVLFPGYRRA